MTGKAPARGTPRESKLIPLCYHQSRQENAILPALVKIRTGYMHLQSLR